VIGVDTNAEVCDIATSPGYVGHVVDVTSEQAMTGLVLDLRRSSSTVSHLVLAAGGALEEEVGVDDALNVDASIFRRSIDLNLTGQYLSVKHLHGLVEPDPWLRR
jgi:NAD(P)-dependent dehydrogenase (short-subunit alcohol dehydrogenase family)